VSVFALIAQWISGYGSFTLEDRHRVQRYNNRTSLGFIDCTSDYTSSDCVFCIFDAARQYVGICFEYSGFVQFHPFLVWGHSRRLLSLGWEKGINDD